MNKKFCAQKNKRGLTIEYAILMMALSVAFILLVLTAATTTTKNAASYQSYVERKQYLDEIGSVYIQNQGKTGCLDQFEDNKYGYFWREYSKTSLLVLQGDLETHAIVLRVELDANGTVVLYRYGV